MTATPGRRLRAIDVARYQVESRPDGPVGRLGVTARTWPRLTCGAGWPTGSRGLRSFRGEHEETGVAWFWGEVAVEGGVPTLARSGFGPHPDPDDRPRIPLADLLDAAVAELRTA